jgi:hypothetical protein
MPSGVSHIRVFLFVHLDIILILVLGFYSGLSGREDSMRRMFIKKYFIFRVGSVCRVKRFTTGWQTFHWWRRGWNGGAEVAETVWLLRSLFCGAPSLTRGRVCLLYILLALASAVFLRSESLGTCDRILLSQIWDFPFRRLLRLAGSRERYSTPPPHGCPTIRYLVSRITSRHGPHRKHSSSVVVVQPLHY